MKIPGVGAGSIDEFLALLRSNIDSSILYTFPLFSDELPAPKVIVDYEHLSEIDIKTLRDDGYISNGLFNKLSRNNYILLTDVLHCRRKELMKLPTFGKTAMDELIAFLSHIIPEERRGDFELFDEGDSVLSIPECSMNDSLSLLGLSKRTLNSLNRGYFYTLGDLNGLGRKEIFERCRGMGKKCLDELFNSSLLPDYLLRRSLATLPPAEQLKTSFYISDYIKNNFPERYVDMFFLKFAHNDDTAYLKYGISRQAVSQKIDKIKKGLREAFASNLIAPFIRDSITDMARKGFKLTNENNFDPLLPDSAVVKIINMLFPGFFYIYKNQALLSTWVLSYDYNADKIITLVRNYLSEKIYTTDEELYSIADIPDGFVDDMKIVHRYGKYISSISSEKYLNIIIFVNENSYRSFSVREIAEKYGYDESYVRNTLLRLPNVVNVGMSKYALFKDGYHGTSPYKTLDIIVDLLEKEGKPILRERLVDEVLKVRDINRNSVIQAIYSNSDTLTEIEGNKVALAKWGYEARKYDHNSYENKLEDVVLKILKTSFFPLTIKEISKEIRELYGDTASDNATSIHAALQKLKQQYPLVQSMHGQEASYFLDDDGDK